MRKSIIVDSQGNPINTEELKTGIDEAQLTGMRNLWSYDSIASGLTPIKLAAVLEAAAQGQPHDFFTLAEEMEERDLHYACELSKRKLAVSGIEPIIESATDDQRGVNIASELRQLITPSIISDLIDGCLDGLGKGYSAVEQNWDTSSKQWMPKKYIWRDPRFLH